MHIYKTPKRIALAGFLVLTFFSCSFCYAQTVKKNPDGTVEVMDDEASTVTPVGGGPSHSRSHGATSGRIPAYTKRMGGVSVHRNADGTIEVRDVDMKTTMNTGGSPAPRRSSKPSKTAKKTTSKAASKAKK